jgi:transcriptional regulator
MARVDSDTLYGTLNLLILRTLEAGPHHGLDIARKIGAISRDVLRVEEGALYPALHRLERDSLIEAEWGVSENNRRARFYTLTRHGEARLAAEKRKWVRHARAVSEVLGVFGDLAS